MRQLRKSAKAASKIENDVKQELETELEQQLEVAQELAQAQQWHIGTRTAKRINGCRPTNRINR